MAKCTSSGPRVAINSHEVTVCRAANEEEGRQQFKDLKDQSIGLGYAPLWTSWATLEAKHGGALELIIQSTMTVLASTFRWQRLSCRQM